MRTDETSKPDGYPTSSEVIRSRLGRNAGLHVDVTARPTATSPQAVRIPNRDPIIPMATGPTREVA